MNRKVGQILGINVNSSSKESVLTRVESFISDSTKFYIVTPNPELILMAQKNLKLKKALNSADIAIPDGIGLSQASKYLSLELPKGKLFKTVIGFFQGLRVGASTFINRKWLTKDISPIKGRELFMDLISLANKRSWKVFLLGGVDNEAELATRKLRIDNLKCKIEAKKGPILDKEAKPLTTNDVNLEKEAIDQINKFKPNLLFVAFGNPKQEIWIHENIGKLNIGGAMAVGGTFRYVSGLSPLPPEWMGRIGLEWLYRAVTEPYRIIRIFRAVIIFPIKVFLDKISR